eukprot:gnl/Hemi2/8853_TR3060_c0_g1_i1.p2 gnl/Hemi2/8853_TR3060_c0_g1~~gnl/Hemi2/8853_TR3060_c0_g1_i1.p2  ORF type:complete len:111 (+),score=23.23 gnl/Hemi2/8853_TR3060_c0_g1_i1:69-401(+)
MFKSGFARVLLRACGPSGVRGFSSGVLRSSSTAAPLLLRMAASMPPAASWSPLQANATTSKTGSKAAASRILTRMGLVTPAGLLSLLMALASEDDESLPTPVIRFGIGLI